VIDEIAEYLDRQGIATVRELVGLAHGADNPRSAYHLG
jgi:hypothetical protein